jgi:RHS repeat-associated protein
MRHIGAAQTDYVWDLNRGLPEILQETVGSGTTSYVYGVGRISSTDGSGNQKYFTADGLGSTTDLTDASHSRTDGYTYDEFGAATHSPGSSMQPFEFAGQQTDADSGLQYLRARYYDPATGRFPSRDPLMGTTRSPGSLNRYSYAWNNPTSLTDPSGLSPSKEGGQSITITIDLEDNPYLIANRILSALMPRLDDACLRDYACTQSSHTQLTALAPVAVSLMDLLKKAQACNGVASNGLSGLGLLSFAYWLLNHPPTASGGATVAIIDPMSLTRFSGQFDSW